MLRAPIHIAILATSITLRPVVADGQGIDMKYFLMVLALIALSVIGYVRYRHYQVYHIGTEIEVFDGSRFVKMHVVPLNDPWNDHY